MITSWSWDNRMKKERCDHGRSRLLYNPKDVFWFTLFLWANPIIAVIPDELISRDLGGSGAQRHQPWTALFLVCLSPEKRLTVFPSVIHNNAPILILTSKLFYFSPSAENALNWHIIGPILNCKKRKKKKHCKGVHPGKTLLRGEKKVWGTVLVQVIFLGLTDALSALWQCSIILSSRQMLCIHYIYSE